MAIKRIFNLIFSCALAILSLGANAQDFSTTTVGAEAGVEGSFVNDAVQDEFGYLWVATEVSLSKYNGVDFLKLDIADTTGLSYATSLCSGGLDQMLVGLNTGFVLMYSASDVDTMFTGDSSSSIVQMLEYDNLFYGIDASFNFFGTNDSGTFSTIRLNQSEEIFANPNSFQITENKLVVGTNEGLYIWQLNHSDTVAEFVSYVPEFEFVNITALRTIDKNKLLVGTEDNGFWEINVENETESKHINVQRSMASLNVSDIQLIDEKHLWISTKFEGIYIIELNFEKEVTAQSLIRHLGSDIIPQETNKLMLDKEGGIWVGVPGAGMVQVLVNPFEYFEDAEFNFGKVNDVTSFTHDQLLIATDSGLIIARIHADKDSCSFNYFENAPRQTFSSLFFEKQNSVVAATVNGNVFRITTSLIEKIELKFDFTGIDLKSIRIDNQGNFWIILDGLGAAKFSPNGELLKRYDIANGFLTNDIRYIFFDLFDNIFFGTYVGGLVREGSDGDLSFVSKEDKFPFVDINTIYQHTNNRLVIGSSGSGLIIIENDSLYGFDKKDGLFDNYVVGIQTDENNNLWSIHRNGISRIDVDSRKIISFGKRDGFPEVPTMTNSFTADDFGNLWIGHHKGLTWLHSPVDNYSRTYFPTFFTAIKSNKNQVENQKQTSNNESQFFEHDKNNFSFEFVAISLRYPGRMKYEYKLEGANGEASDISSLNRAVYNNLSPGEYSFKVNTFFNGIKWTEQPIEYSFEIKKPFWQELWFYLLQFGVFFLLVLATIFIGIRQYTIYTKIMLYITLFLVFDYVEILVEPYFRGVTGSAPVFQVLSRLLLALFLFPIEGYLKGYFRKRNEERAVTTKTD